MSADGLWTAYSRNTNSIDSCYTRNITEIVQYPDRSANNMYIKVDDLHRIGAIGSWDMTLYTSLQDATMEYTYFNGHEYKNYYSPVVTDLDIEALPAC